MSSSRKNKHSPSNLAPTNGLVPQSQATSQQLQFPTKLQSQSHSQSPQQTQQSQPPYPWSAHTPPPRQWPSPFPRRFHALSTSATAAGELFLFGGFVRRARSPKNDVHVISTRDFSTTLLQTTGDVPDPRYGHRAVRRSTTFLIWGGRTDFSDQSPQNHRNDDSLCLLNLVSREWSRIVVHGPGPGSRYYHTMTLVGSKLFVFGGRTAKGRLNDIWALDLNSLISNPFWESYDPAPGNEKPLPRVGHVSVTTGDRIIIFGGRGDPHDFNDTWSFNISARKWTELQCTGSIPSPRTDHAAVLVDDVMYVFGGLASDETKLGDLTAFNLSTQRWTAFQDTGPSPCGRRSHAMASDGRRIFVIGGNLSPGALVDEAKLIYVLDTILINPKPGSNTVEHSKKTTQLAQKVSTGHPTQGQPQHRTFSSSEEIAPLEDGHLIELERQLSETLVAKTERDRRIAQLTDELALKNALLEQAEANAAEAEKHAGLKLRELQAKLDESLPSRDHAFEQAQSALQKAPSAAEANEQSRRELAEMRAELEASNSELAACRLRLADMENGRAESKAEPDICRNQTATGHANADEDRVVHRLMERVQAMEAEIASMRWNEKSFEMMECRNEG